MPEQRLNTRLSTGALANCFLYSLVSPLWTPIYPPGIRSFDHRSHCPKVALPAPSKYPQLHSKYHQLRTTRFQFRVVGGVEVSHAA